MAGNANSGRRSDKWAPTGPMPALDVDFESVDFDPSEALKQVHDCRIWLTGQLTDGMPPRNAKEYADLFTAVSRDIKVKAALGREDRIRALVKRKEEAVRKLEERVAADRKHAPQ